MKKFIMVSMIALIAAFGFVGCGADDDGSKADIRWNNNSSLSIYEVKWVSGGDVDQTWDQDLTDNETATDISSYKGINKLTGQGECLDVADRGTASEGTPLDISIDGSLNYSVAENASETLNVTQAAKK